MGKRYTKEELKQIQTLSGEGRTNREIASLMGRPEAGIRNLRHRHKLKTDTRETVQLLKGQEKNLTVQISTLQRQVQRLQARRNRVVKTLHTEEKALQERLVRALTKLKDEKPELFKTTIEEQIGKLAAELLVTGLKWLVT